MSDDITYTWNLKKKNDTNDFIYKREIDSQTWRTNLQLPGETMGGKRPSLGLTCI